MTRLDEPIALEGMLRDEGLDVRSARIERCVHARLDEAPARARSLLAHPALAAAAMIVCLVVRLALGGSPTSPSGQGARVSNQITLTETGLGEMLPSWLRQDGGTPR